jgi:hypothetical protein
MADAPDAHQLLLQINANVELLRSNLSAAERLVKNFTDKTQHHLDDSDKRFEHFGHAIERLEGPLEHLKRVGEGAFAFLIGESLIEKGKEALEFAGNIEFAAQKIGVTTTFLQQFRYAASQSGASIEVAETALSKFTRSIGEAANGNKAVIELFDRLGVKVLDASGKVRSVEKIYLDTSTAISKIEAPAQRAADTYTLMGRGAGALIPLMARGAQGFSELAAAANELGVVLSPDLIEHAEDVNHKMAALKLILDAQMASAVAQNAQAIGNIATALVQAAGAVAKFLGSDPAKALGLLGGLAGAKLAGGPGSAIGALAGVAYGKHLDDENNDLEYRRQRLHAAAEQVKRDMAAPVTGLGGSIISFRHEGEGSQVNLRQAWHDLKIEQDRYRRALAANKGGSAEAGPGGGSDEAGASNPATGHHKAKKGKSAEQLAREAEAKRQRALAEDSAFDRELRSAQVAYQHAEAALADTAQNQLAAELASLQDALITRRDEIDNQLSAGKISQARRDQLVLILEKTEADQEEMARRKRDSRILAEKLAHGQLELQGQIEMLGLDERLADTRKERLKIELQLLELQRQQAIRDQQKIIDDPTSTAAQRSDAATRQGQINAQFPKAQKGLEDQYASPLTAYKDQLKRDTADMTDALQSVQVDGIKSLQDGLIGIISGTESVGSAFKKMADTIIADLARIAIEKAIVSILGSLAGGGVNLGGGSSHDIGNGSKGFAAGHIPGFAGGLISGRGSGTSDSILAYLQGKGLIRVSNGESIMTANATERYGSILAAMNDNRLPGFAEGNVPSMRGIRAPAIPNLAGMGSAGSAPIQINTTVHIDGGASEADRAAMRNELAQRDAELPGKILQTVSEANSRFVALGFQ